MKKVLDMIKNHWREYSIFLSCSFTFMGLSIFEMFSEETVPMWMFSFMVSVLSFLLFLSFAFTREIIDDLHSFYKKFSEDLNSSYKKFSEDLFKMHVNFVENLDKSFKEIKPLEEKLSEKDNG